MTCGPCTITLPGKLMNFLPENRETPNAQFLNNQTHFLRRSQTMPFLRARSAITRNSEIEKFCFQIRTSPDQSRGWSKSSFGRAVRRNFYLAVKKCGLPCIFPLCWTLELMGCVAFPFEITCGIYCLEDTVWNILNIWSSVVNSRDLIVDRGSATIEIFFGISRKSCCI